MSRYEIDRKGDHYAKAVLAALALKIVKVRANFEGSGDDGSIQDIECFDAENNLVVATGEHKAFEDLMYDAVNAIEHDWVNNDGGFGYLEWRPNPKKEEEDKEGEDEGAETSEFYYNVDIRYIETENYEGSL